MAKRKRNGLTLLGVAQKVNPIPRYKDNTSDLEREELRLRSKRKWQAPELSVPGKTVTAPPRSETQMPG